MANNSAHFRVNSRLAKLLSQEYTSSEKALKELVDNAWDADADSVRISLPEPMTDSPIVINDNGTGMTTEEVRRHYLDIAADRRSNRGNRTVGKNRLVKGRKGIGKFAGLMAASSMTLETYARGVCSAFTVRLVDLEANEGIEKLSIQISQTPCDNDTHGTTITLANLHSGFRFPDPKTFRQVLLLEYGREAGFDVVVNEKLLGVDDVRGAYQNSKFEVEGVGPVQLKFAIGESKSVSRQPGIVIRVDGKAIGKPSFFGLDERDDFPPKLLKRLYGEIDADGLRNHVTAGWDSLVENSELLGRVTNEIAPQIYEAFKTQFGRELQLAQARLKREFHDRLAALPEHRRAYAERAVKKVIERFFDDPPDKVESYIFVLLEAIERSDYGSVLEHIADSSKSDVASIAEALAEFGLADMAYLVAQSKARQAFLDRLEILAKTPETLEKQMHQAIEKNLWMLGSEYSLFSSNKTLQRQVEDLLGKKYQGEKTALRPDLLLNENLNGEYLLIEFKRPSHPLNRDDYVQATGYRHDLRKTTEKHIRVIVIGDRCSPDFPTENLEPDVIVATFLDLISTARRQLEWQLRTNN